MKYANIREEAIKLKVGQDFFDRFDCTDIQGFIDFAVKLREQYLLWAEAKQKTTDMLEMLTQLVLTIGKARTFDKFLPPAFLGCFDCEKIAFVPYHSIQDIFYQNDFNWNITPSKHDTREFKQVYAQIKKIIDNDIPFETYVFDFERDGKDLKRFIRENFVLGKSEITKIKIDKNNFNIIYQKWVESVKPTIAINWDIAKKNEIIDGDFYLADLLSENNISLKEKLFVLLKSTFYEANRHIDKIGMFTSSRVDFLDNQRAYNSFWTHYERPPQEDYWDYMIDHRHLLVPQDLRERKGSYYTPRQWVELSQKYIADVFGEDWQDEYYVWDCCSGTGNLLAGLTNKYNIWASTLDKQDVNVMHDRIENGANLLHDHVFQFDFLNDDFSKLPESLQKIINDPKKRKKLIVYINPPYAEAGTGLGKGHKDNVALVHKTYSQYKNKIGKATNELFTQFLARIYCEIPTAKIANFSKLKNLQSSNFSDFRNFIRAKLEKIFLTPANTFDNVKGAFPIGFFIWNTEKKEKFEQVTADVYVEKNNEPVFLTTKNLYSYDNEKGLINDWLRLFFDKKSEPVGIMHNNKNDFQHNIQVRITSDDIKDHTTPITKNNLIEMCIYFAVRKVIPADWLNDRDQFLYPNDGWKTDLEFQNDCFAYTLFNNNIQLKYGINYWIPFTEYQVGARDKFDSNFMTDFIAGKVPVNNVASEPMLFYGNDDNFSGSGSYYKKSNQPREFSPEATAVFEAGKELWKYYHSQKNINVNASLYDIREYFQGRNDKGKMNNTSKDEKYNELIGLLRERLKILAQKIKLKVYEYEFLKA
ncbi:hypothetical protein AGMMS50262_13190 [Bacteroidia bacterium]|nr:hypothetical protein AGMMS50262_13190 [Bacteroidia bacterium]